MSKKKKNTNKYLVLRKTKKSKLFRKKAELELPILII